MLQNELIELKYKAHKYDQLMKSKTIHADFKKLIDNFNGYFKSIGIDENYIPPKKVKKTKKKVKRAPDYPEGGLVRLRKFSVDEPEWADSIRSILS